MHSSLGVTDHLGFSARIEVPPPPAKFGYYDPNIINKLGNVGRNTGSETVFIGSHLSKKEY